MPATTEPQRRRVRGASPPGGGGLPVRRRRAGAGLPPAGRPVRHLRLPHRPKNTAKKNLTHGESYGFAVFKNKDERKQQGALQAALWGARPDFGLVFAQTGGTPPAYKHAVESPELQAAFKNDAEVWPFYELSPNFVPMPNFPGFAEVRALGDTMIRDIWLQKLPVREGLNEYTRLAQQRLDEVLQ